MFWLVETEDQLDRLYESNFKEAFIEIIPYDYREHPCQNQICAVYIRPLESTKGFIIPYNHSETFKIDINKAEKIIEKFDKIYVRDKKEFLHYYPIQTLFDITLHCPTYIPEQTPTHYHFHKNNQNAYNASILIPIVKHYEYCEKIFNNVKSHINDQINEFYNNDATMVFNAIERNGIRINRREFEKNFYVPNSDFVFTQFNFKTLTRRPSNKFKKVNYAALKKDNGERKSFIPNNDLFVELDISAYHPTLLAHLVHYKFNTDDIHEAFSKMYGVDYKTAKEITFKQLYGGIFKEYKELEFFKKVQKYIDELWQKFQSDGYIEVPISKWKFKRDELENMNPQKLLNYLLQGLETAMNVRILWEIMKVLKGKNTKVVLYTYDSFLFDLDKSEKDTFNLILKIFEKYKLTTKMNYGTDYDFR
tara:strand:+ start:7334 stop:8593 length:1260 start_codon:yes stop_codon:yes gene_type:complete